MSSSRILLPSLTLQLPLASACSPAIIGFPATAASNLAPRLKYLFGEVIFLAAYDICPCSETGLFAGDVFTDAITGVELITEGHIIWGTVSLVLICLPVAVVGLFILWILCNGTIEWIGKAKDWLTCCSISAGEEENERRRRSLKITPDCPTTSNKIKIALKSAGGKKLLRLANRNEDMGGLCRLVFSVLGLSIIVALYVPAVILITTLYIVFVILCGVKQFCNPTGNWEAEFEAGGWGGIFSPTVAMILMAVEVCLESGPQSSVGEEWAYNCK